jgi:hypothetical protein
LILGLLTALVRFLWMEPAEPPTAAGAAIMAIGIFGLGPLPGLPFSMPPIPQLLALELLVLWSYVAAGLAASALRGNFHLHLDDPVGCFAIGTWVAGTVVVARLLNTVVPSMRAVAVALALVACLAWLAFLVLILKRFVGIVAGEARLKVTGRILLSTVSTQSVVIVLAAVLPDLVPRWLLTGLITLGYLFYAVGFVLIIRRYVQQRGWGLSEDWDNTNCIIHGAMSITGLAAALTRAIPDAIIVISWLWAAALFLVVEGVELARLRERVRLYGWRRGLLTYNVSQWARNFTFGMFYSFTLQMHNAMGSPSSSWFPPLDALLWPVQGAIIAWGHYVVFILLLIEAGLFFAHNLASRSRARAPQIRAA